MSRNEPLNPSIISPKPKPNPIQPPVGQSVEKTPEESEKILALDKICLENGKHLGSFKNSDFLGGGKQIFQNTRKMHLFIAGANLCHASKCIS